MHSPSLPTNPDARRRRRAKPIDIDHPAPRRRSPKVDKRVNLTFDTWFRRRTELPKKITGWTPFSILYSDYLTFCRDTKAEADIIDEKAFRTELSGRCDRLPRELLCTVGLVRRYAECWPRYLIPPIQLGSFN